jgi:hypothetical protein
MNDLQELLAALAELNPDPRAFAEALRESDALHKYYQQPYNEGHSGATTASKNQLSDAEQAQTALQAELEEAKAAVAELQKKNPDLEKIQADHAAELTRLQETGEKAIQDANERLQAERLARVESEFLRKATSPEYGEMDDDYAEVMFERHRQRFQFGDDGDVLVLQDGLSIPFSNVPENKTQLDLLLKEVQEKTDPKFLGSSVPSGAGHSGGGSGGGIAHLDAAKAAGEQARASQSASQVDPTLAFS